MEIKEIEQFVIESGSDSLAVFGGKFEGGIHIQQIPDEIAPCISEILKSGKIKSYLEIGVAAGGTAFVFNHYFHPEIVLIDDNKHHKAALRPKVMDKIIRHEIIRKSGDNAAIAAAQDLSPYDLILIDGDHSYQGVNADVKNYLPMLNKEGFLVFHDSARSGFGIKRMVKELKKDTSLKFINEYVSKKMTPCGVALFRRVK